MEVLAAELRARGLAFSDVLAAVRPLLAARPAASLAELEALRLRRPGRSRRTRRTRWVQRVPAVRDVARVRVRIVMPSGLSESRSPAVGGIVIANGTRPIGPLIRAVARLALESVRAQSRPGVPATATTTALTWPTRRARMLAGALAEEVAVVRRSDFLLSRISEQRAPAAVQRCPWCCWGVRGDGGAGRRRRPS